MDAACGALVNPCSLTEAASVANTDDTLVLLGGEYLLSSTVVLQVKGVSIRSNATFGHAHLSCAQRGYPAISLDVIGSVVVDSLTFSDCSSGIFTTGTGLIGDLLLKDLKMSGMSNSAIQFQSDTITSTIQNCVFANNSVRTSGGAITAGSSTTVTQLFIWNSLFLNNSAWTSGGAIYFLYGQNFTILNSSFLNNTVNPMEPQRVTGGGAIMIREVNYVKFSKCLFEKNFCNGTSAALGAYGGAILISNPSVAQFQMIVDMKSCVFSRNLALGFSTTYMDGLTGSAGGGAFEMEAGSGVFCNLTIDDCVFSENVASAFSVSGGAVYIDPSDFTAVNVSNSTFIGNFANASAPSSGLAEGNAGTWYSAGGAWLTFGPGSYLHSFVNVSFWNNRAEVGMLPNQLNRIAYGGGLFLVDVPSIFMNCIFEGNIAQGGGGSIAQIGQGGGMSIQFSDLEFASAEFVNCVFRNNTSLSDIGSNGLGGTGGGLALVSVPTLGGTATVTKLVLQDCIFEANTATGKSKMLPGSGAAQGGGLYIEHQPVSPSVREFEFRIQNCSFIENVVKASMCESVAATADGGAISAVIYFPSGLSIENSTFRNNMAIGGTAPASPFCGIGAGGAVSISTLNADLESVILVSRTNFEGNIARPGGSGSSGASVGGALALAVRRVHIMDSNFSNNTADNFGGAIFHGNSLGVGYRSLTQSEDLMIQRSSFDSNFASLQNGGAVHAETVSSVNASDVRFGNNSAMNGACFSLNNVSSFALNNSFLTWNNVSSSGGALWFSSVQAIQLQNSVFSNNTALLGGVFWSLFANLEIKNCTLTSNSAFTGGIGFVERFTTSELDALFAELNVQSHASTNFAVSGNILATPGQRMNIFGLSETIWPGQRVVSEISILDGLDQRTVNQSWWAWIDNTGSGVVAASSTLIAPDIETLVYRVPVLQVVAGSSDYDITFMILDHPTPSNSSRVLSLNEITWSPNLVSCPPVHYGPDATGVCPICPPNTFSFSGTLCLACPSKSDCVQWISDVNASFAILKGFYPDLKNGAILHCTNEACAGTLCSASVLSGRSNWSVACNCSIDDMSCGCSEGYNDRACSRCSPNYFRLDEECIPCKPVQIWVVILLSVAGIGSLLGFVVARTPSTSLAWGEISVLLFLVGIGVSEAWLLYLVIFMGVVELLVMQHGAQTEESDVLMTVSGAWKIFIYFLQTSSSLNGNFWYPVTERLSFLDLRVSNLECAFEFLSRPSSKLALVLLVPVILIAVVVVLVFFRSGCELIVRSCSKCKKKAVRPSIESLNSEQDALLMNNHENHSFDPTLFQRMEAMSLFVCYVMYFEVVGACFAVFRCDSFGYWEEQVWLPCNVFASQEYRVMFILGVCFAFVYGFGIPFLYFLLLRRNKEKLTTPKNEFRFGFFFENYKREFYLFELVWIGRRFLLALVISAIPHESVWSTFFVLSALLASLALQYWVQPFKKSVENVMDISCTIVIIFTFGVTNGVSDGFNAVDGILLGLHGLIVVTFLVLIIVPKVRSYCKRRRSYKLNSLETR